MCLKFLLGSGEDPPNRPEVEVSDRQGDQDSCYGRNRLTFFYIPMKVSRSGFKLGPDSREK